MMTIENSQSRPALPHDMPWANQSTRPAHPPRWNIRLRQDQEWRPTTRRLLRGTLLTLAGWLLWPLPAQAETPGKIVNRNELKDGVQVIEMDTEHGIQVKISILREDVFRIQMAPKGGFSDPLNNPEKAQIVIDHSQQKVPVRVESTADTASFSTPKFTLRLDKNTCQFALFDANQHALWNETKPVDLTAGSTVQSLTTGLDECIVGGGQQNGYFSHKGTRILIEADGNWNEGGKPNPSPFYMSNRGYGVLRNTFSQGTYDFTGNDSITLTHNERRLDAYYLVGDSFNRVIDLYTQFTGRPNFVPIWALELGEADAYMTRDKETREPAKNPDGGLIEITPHVISRLAEQYRKHDMPGGWILPNDGYGCGYVELDRVVRSLHDLGFYTGLWTENGLEKTRYEVGTAGTRLQKLDVAWTGPAYQFGLDASKQAWESLTTNSDTRGFVWTVQGWAGTQRYAVCWTGDQYGSWDLIRYHIPTLIGSGLSGQAYATTDVDGIFGGSPETFTRDLQWKCFTPVLYVMNGWAGKMNKSPWWYDEPYRSINRSYLKLKMRMTPYMYHYAREAYETGAPIVRGMIWNYPADRHTWTTATQHQYLLGDSLLVAPVYTSMKANQGWRKEDIYLPAGTWIDYWDGRRIEGPTVIDAYPITLEKLPILVKAGAIIPMYPEMLYNNQKPKDPLTFAIYPSGNSKFDLYEDDGLTRKHQTGEFSRQLIEVTAPAAKAGDIQVTVGPRRGTFDGVLLQRAYQFEIHSELKPLSIAANGQPVLELTDPGAYDNSVSAWYFDPADRRGVVRIKLPGRPTDQPVTLTLDIDENAVIPASPPYPKPSVSPLLDKSEFKFVSNSQQGQSLAAAFDNNPESHWHSYYGKDPKSNAVEPPYTVDIDLNGLYAVNSLRYLARQDLGNGLLKDVEVYVSRSATDFGTPVYKGSFEGVKQQQTAAFPAKWGEFVRIKVLSSVNGGAFASAAEFDLTQDLALAPLPDETIYLSDLEPARASGGLKKNLSVMGNPIQVNEQTYPKGLGVDAPSELVYPLDGSWDRFSGNVGMDDEVGDAGSVMFRVYADDKLVFESPPQTGKSVKQLVDLNVKGVKELRLVVLDAGDGSANDHADWVDAKLIRSGSRQ